ncbi:MAG: sec-independent protein translocase protein TatB [Pseudonocardiales bacterium]|jgi:sec-independent protein translocase protein TatB|nr:sec-independent protein translocase protein TatB [Pseudonocardiales bacterium]MDT4945057.1 sec-independent protein translocase protein TatB [Pseudonocardiales bacterium]
MFNVGPMELMVLALVGLVVLGPDRLPGLAKDAARMIRTLRDMATGARTQLREELGPEFADVDLRNLNPRTAISRVILGDDADKLRDFNPRTAMENMIMGDEPAADTVSLEKSSAEGKPLPPAPKPLGRGEQAPYDSDAT